MTTTHCIHDKRACPLGGCSQELCSRHEFVPAQSGRLEPGEAFVSSDSRSGIARGSAAGRQSRSTHDTGLQSRIASDRGTAQPRVFIRRGGQV